MTKEQYDFLTQSGAQPHLRGFEYLADFLDIFDKSESKDIRICKEVYGAIAEKRNVSSISVERDIRHLIADRHKVMELRGKPKKNSHFLMELGYKWMFK